MKLHKITFVLLIIGGLNWGLHVFGYGIGEYLSANVANVIYILVALSAIAEIFGHKKLCRNCAPQGGAM